MDQTCYTRHRPPPGFRKSRAKPKYSLPRQAIPGAGALGRVEVLGVAVGEVHRSDQVMRITKTSERPVPRGAEIRLVDAGRALRFLIKRRVSLTTWKCNGSMNGRGATVSATTANRRILSMSMCPHCGGELSPPSKIPWWKYDAPRTNLGCGTLLLIGIVVAIFSPRDTSSVERVGQQVQALQEKIDGLAKAIDKISPPAPPVTPPAKIP